MLNKKAPSSLTADTPNIWVVGDVQGCYEELERLLSHPAIANDPTCKIWFAGDIINRGPQSLKTLKTIMKLGDKATMVLGNHDLHLLAVSAGIRTQNKSDTIDDILNSKRCGDYIDWLRHRPLAYYENKHLMVHAGVMASWNLEKTLSLAHEIEDALRSSKWQTKLQKMYGNEPNYWDNKFTGSKRLRVIVNAFTRMRMCYSDGSMEFVFKESPKVGKNKQLLPWFELDNRQIESDCTILFGHWSTLGLMVRPNLIALDTGCVWGGQLTAIRLQDRALVQIQNNRKGKQG